jgi:hypothetical protein
LPLEAESLVDEELAKEGDDGHDNGNTVFVLVHLISPPCCRAEHLPKDNN